MHYVTVPPFLRFFKNLKTQCQDANRRTAQKRVAILGSFPPIRGLSSYCFQLALAMAELGQVEFISFKKIYPPFIYPGGGLKDDHTFPATGHSNLSVRRRLTWYNPMTWFVEGFFTRAELLHAQCWSLPLLLVYAVVCSGFKLRGKPVVFTVHNVLPHERSYLHVYASRMLFRLGDHYIVHSESNRAQLIRFYGISPQQVSLIPHGPLDFHVRDEMDRQASRKELGFHPDDRVILLFGAIRPYKGIDTALRAFAKVLKEIPQARLLIAGKLWEGWEVYARIIDELGVGRRVKTNLTYIPSAEVYKFFVTSDLVVLPYHHFESQSGVGAIAVSFHKPMIVTKVGGLPELVEDSRLVVPPMDPNALAQAIIKCMKNDARLEAMSAGAEALAARLAWPAIAKKTWEVYQTVLGLEETRVEQ